MTDIEHQLKKGTTTVAMVCKDGVVMGTERRATAGTLIAHKATKKLYKLDKNLGLTTAGLVGDIQVLARYISAEVELYKFKRDRPMSVKACATLTSNILSGRRYFPYWVQLIIGGVDDAGSHVFSLDAAGGSIPDDYVATGSGSPYVYGVMEDHYRTGLTVKDGVDLAVRAIHAAIRRDAVSGDGIDIATITPKDGFAKVGDADVEKRIQSMKLA